MTRVAIIGGGVAGAATAWFLAARGEHDVVLLERERLLGTESSGRNAAILRTLGPDPVTSAFARRGARFLLAPPDAFAPTPLVEPCGLVLTADARGAPELRRWLADAGPACGAEEVEPSAVPELAPGVTSRAVAAVSFPAEGRIDIAALMAAFERGARRGGVAVETGARVESIATERGRVRGVRLASGEFLDAERVVLAAGGWAGELGRRAGSGVALEPRRRHLLVTGPEPDVDPGGPVVWHHGERPFYARPESGGMLACACDEARVDPDDRSVDPAVREEALARLGAHFAGLADAGARSFWAGLRTFTSDGRFAIGPDPDVDGLFWVAGLGGHGMVCSAAAGELAAERLLGRRAGASAAARVFDPARLVSRRPATAGPAD